jgi:hypothetical protein
VGVNWNGATPASPFSLGFSVEDERNATYFANISSAIKEILVSGRYLLRYRLMGRTVSGGGGGRLYGTEMLVGPGQTTPVKVDADGLAVSRAYLQPGQDFVLDGAGPFNLAFNAGDRISLGVYRVDGTGGNVTNVVAGPTQLARSFWEMIYLGV